MRRSPKPLARAGSLLFLALASCALVVTSFVPGRLGELDFAFLALLFPLALMVLGASRGGRLGPVLRPVLILAAILGATLFSMLVLHHRGDGASLVFGLPSGLVLLLLGFFLLPLIVVSWGYARTFDRWGLRDDDLRTLRRRFGRSREDEP